MKKCYWMWKNQSDKMVTWLTDEDVNSMRGLGYTIIPYDPNIPAHVVVSNI